MYKSIGAIIIQTTIIPLTEKHIHVILYLFTSMNPFGIIVFVCVCVCEMCVHIPGI